jgi:bifunctional non-homologous end joining protein LigD
MRIRRRQQRRPGLPAYFVNTLRRQTAMTNRTPANASDAIDIAGVRLTHPQRLLFPAAGLSKLDLARYAEDMAAWILPHLAHRPLTLVRCPQGEGHPCFFQRHAHGALPAGLERIAAPGAKDADADYLLANSATALVGLVQIAALEWHVWGSTQPQLDKPDRIIFDLDPAPDLPWRETVAAAQLLRELLEDMQLISFVKTTGGKGLHLVVPILAEHSWEEARAWARALAERLEASWPKRFVSDMSKSKRDGKIFIDYLRNAIEASAVASYSPRAKPHAPVSTPLSWDELDAGLRPDSFTIATLPQRMKSLDMDPWANYFSLRQKLHLQSAAP